MTKLARDAAEPDPGPVVFCDFDGTISQRDVTDEILAQLAHPSWREIEQEWMLGLIGSRECLERQIALVDAPIEELQAVIDSVTIDPEFTPFCKFVRKKHLPLYILSDGFDYVIRRVLKSARVDRHYRAGANLYASVLRVEGHRLAPSFPYPPEPCEHGCATCKAALIQSLRNGRQPVIFVGDGLSDRFAVQFADVVFAKRHLLSHCRESGITCYPFENFKDVQTTLDKLLTPVSASPYRQAVAALS